MKQFTDDFIGGPKLDRLGGHQAFIRRHLEFGSDLKVARTKVSRLYCKWLGVKNFAPKDVHNLYALLEECHEVRKTSTHLFGVRIKGE